MKMKMIRLFVTVLSLSIISTPVFAEDNQEAVVKMIDTTEEQQSDNIFMKTSTYEIIIPVSSNNTRASVINTDNDSTISMEVTLKSTYVKNGTDTAILLTGVSGSWRPLDSRVYIKQTLLEYGCSSISGVTQTGVQFPSSSPFSYSTGFTEYVAKDGGSEVGSRLTLALARGGSTWNFVITSSVINSNLGLF